jgi:alpha-L-rhamnosidase
MNGWTTDGMPASWITLDSTSIRANQPTENRVDIETAAFRLAFPGCGSGRLQIRVSANARYKLYLNGALVSVGPRKGDRHRHFFEEINWPYTLPDGNGVLSAVVVSYPPREAWDNGNIAPSWAVGNAAGPCLLLSGSWIPDTGDVPVNLSTGTANWQALRLEAIQWTMFPLSFWHGPLETIDLRLQPQGWMMPMEGQIACTSGTSGTSTAFPPWLPVRKRWPVERSPYGVVPLFPLRNNTLPPMRQDPGTFLREMPLRPDDRPVIPFQSKWAVVPPNSIQVVELDAGTLKTAYPILHFRKGAGSRIRVLYAEAYSTDKPDGSRGKGIRDDNLTQTLAGHADLILADGREWTYEPFWFRVFRFIRLEVETASQPLEITRPLYRETGYPLQPETTVTASEDWFAGAFDISLRTLQCCMQETYVDCPYYEQMQYTLDTRLQILFTHALCGDTRLSLLAMEDYHASLLPEGMIQSRCPSGDPQVIPFFAPAWIQMLEDHWWQTGDLAPARRYRPTVDAILDWFERQRTDAGLIGRTDYWQILDSTPEWHQNHGEPTALHHGPSSLLNLMVVLGLQSAARLCDATGRREQAAEYLLRAEDMLEALRKRCMVEEGGMLPEGPGYRQFSQQTQALAVLTGLFTDDAARVALRQALTVPGTVRCGYPMVFYLLRALEKANLYDLALPLFDDWKHMLAMHLTTTPEFRENTRSDCHAWSALPLYEFPRCFLGVRPAKPGWEEILVEPLLQACTDMKGRVFTPKGSVTVHLQCAGNRILLSGSTPVGTSAIVRLTNTDTLKLPEGGPFNLEATRACE